LWNSLNTILDEIAGISIMKKHRKLGEVAHSFFVVVL